MEKRTDLTKDTPTVHTLSELDFITFLTDEQKEKHNEDLRNGWLKAPQFEPIITERMKVQHYVINVKLNREEPTVVFSGLCDQYDMDQIRSYFKRYTYLYGNAYFGKTLSMMPTPTRNKNYDYINVTFDVK